MNYTLLFKTKENLQSVISDSDEYLFQFDTNLDRIEYSPNTLLEENQCYKIAELSRKGFFLHS